MVDRGREIKQSVKSLVQRNLPRAWLGKPMRLLEGEMARRTDSSDPATDFREKRKFARTGVSWEGTLETGGETYACVVANLSANGARLHLERPVTGHHWTGILTIPRLGAFRAKVAWSTPKGASEIGLTFQDPPAAVALALAEALPRGRTSTAA